MDDLDQREAFLLAIFANPDDDLPRLVFADWLEERGEGDWAALIRLQCLNSRTLDLNSHEDWNGALLTEQALLPDRQPSHTPEGRGFKPESVITCPADLLADPHEFRRTALLEHPHWYGCTELKVKGGRIASSKPITTILTSPVTQRVARLDLSGAVIGGREDGVAIADDTYQMIDFEYRPTVTLQAVEAFVGARECRRFTHLDLRNNDLDNDAARAILRSPYLTRIESLHLFDGNQLRGRTWAALQDKFGDGVVS